MCLPQLKTKNKEGIEQHACLGTCKETTIVRRKQRKEREAREHVRSQNRVGSVIHVRATEKQNQMCTFRAATQMVAWETDGLTGVGMEADKL